MDRWATSAAPELFWIITGAGALLALGAFALAFVWLRRARLIEDTPTIPIRAAAQGYTELQGYARLLPGPPIVSPLTLARCCWWQYKIEQRQRGAGQRGWSTIDSGTSDDLFLVNDADGACVVDADGARVIPSLHRVWYGHTARPQRWPKQGRAWFGFGDYRYSEKLIQIGDPLHALGLFRTQGSVLPSYDEAADLRELLAEWKRDQRELLRRFDTDRSGHIDLDEWEAARRAALEEIRQRHVAQSLEPDINVLSRPTDGRPYLLSTLPQARLIRRYRWQFAGALLVAFGLGALVVQTLTARGLIG